MNLFAIPPIITNVLIFLIGLLVYFNKRSKINSLFALFCLSMVVWLFFYSLMYLSGDNADLALRFAKLGFLGIIFIPILAYHFIAEFIGRPPAKIIIVLLYGLGVVSMFVSFSDPVYEGIAKYFWGFYPVAGPLYVVFLTMFAVLFVYGVMLLFFARRSAQQKGENFKVQQITYVLIAFAGGTTGFIDYVIKYRIEVYPFGYLSALFFISVIAYAITKHELMDIRLVISRTVAYGIVGLLLVVSFFGLNLLSMPTIVAMIANATLGIFWAFAAHRLRAVIQTPLEEKWITDFYDSDKLVNKIVRGLAPIIEKEAACHLLSEELKNNIKIKTVEVLAPSDELAKLTDVTYDTKNSKVFIPCRSSDRLESVLVLGQKISEDPYSEKDLTLLRTIMIQAQVVLDRIRPYEKIKKEFEINEKKLYEAQLELERSSRLASLGTLTAGVTHEIRNPLCVIRAETERLPDKERDLHYLKEHSQLLLSQVKRIDSIVNRTLGLAKGEKEAKENVNLNDIIESSVKLICAPPATAVTIKRELTEAPLIKGVRDELQQVFDNLVQNALQAMPGGGTLSLKTYRDNDRVVAEVADTGKGIPDEIKDKIFDPFFSTRHEGAGLGLSIVYHNMQDHGGSIQFKSKAGEGTTFILCFPDYPSTTST